jgi:hypothetical protein
MRKPDMSKSDMSALDAITVAAPAGQTARQAVDSFTNAPTLAPFSSEAMAFVGDLSRAILASAPLRKYPETIAFGYWIRTARLNQLKAEFLAQPSSGVLAARGVAFHLAPANVDTIFLYSLVLSLLVGNANVVRISSRATPQVEALLAVINATLLSPAHSAMAGRMAIVRYGHDDAVTAALSSIAHVRIIWGGDTTVNAIRRIPLPPRSTEITFADRISIAVMDAAFYLNDPSHAALSKAFFNDAYWFGQMGCSSPRIVLWHGKPSDVTQARTLFWQRLEDYLATEDPELGPMEYLNKLVAEQSYAILEQAHIRKGRSNMLRVVTVEEAASIDDREHCGGGFFVEATIGDLAEITRLATTRHQTIVSHGIAAEAWRAVLSQGGCAGIDRIVPVGDALTFSNVWDGYNLLRSLTREITIAVV